MILFQPFDFRRCSLILGQLGLVACRLQDLRAPLLGALPVAGDQLALRARRRRRPVLGMLLVPSEEVVGVGVENFAERTYELCVWIALLALPGLNGPE